MYDLSYAHVPAVLAKLHGIFISFYFFFVIWQSKETWIVMFILDF